MFPQTNDKLFFYPNMVFLFLCNRQSSFTAQRDSQKWTFILVYDPLSYNDATKSFSLQTVLNHVLCKKENENTQMLSNSSVHLEAIKGIMPILEESQ